MAHNTQWERMVHERLKRQRTARGATVKHAQLRQEIADLAIAYVENAEYGYYRRIQMKVEELRALDQQYPDLKETT